MTASAFNNFAGIINACMAGSVQPALPYVGVRQHRAAPIGTMPRWSQWRCSKERFKRLSHLGFHIGRTAMMSRVKAIVPENPARWRSIRRISKPPPRKAQRARCAIEIGLIKRDKGLPLYAPEREAVVLTQLKVLNKGPLSDEAIERVFRQIIDEALRLEQEHTDES